MIFDTIIAPSKRIRRSRKNETIKMKSAEWFSCISIEDIKQLIAIKTHQMLQPHFFSFWQCCLIILNQYCLWVKFNPFSVALCRLFLPLTFDTWRYEHLIRIRSTKFSHSLSFIRLSVMWCCWCQLLEYCWKCYDIIMVAAIISNYHK